MELNAATFLCSAMWRPPPAPSQYQAAEWCKVQADGLQRLLRAPLVRALPTCDRFGVPKELYLAVVEDKESIASKKAAGRNATNGISSSAAASSSVVLLPTAEAARQHNWQVVHRIVQDGLQVPEGLDENVITAITERGDTLEALLATKRVYELLQGHRQAEKLEKAKHQKLTKDAGKLGTKSLLHKKPVDASLLKTKESPVAAAAAGNSCAPTSYSDNESKARDQSLLTQQPSLQ